MELGIYTFVENTEVPGVGRLSPTQRLENLLEEAEMADRLGLDVFAIEEQITAQYQFTWFYC